MKNNAELTIGSLRKINDFPFYSARYIGDYKLTDFMNGAISSPEDVAPFFEGLFSEMGKSVSLDFPISPAHGPGCSAFFCRGDNDSVLVGKNLDWKRDPLLLLKTTPVDGYESLSMVNLNFCDLFRLGSIDYNLLMAPYVPLDGMNDQGLVITMLSVNEGGEYPHSPNKLSVGDFNIIRIILDNCATVDEALSSFEQFNLMQTSVLPLHYLIADSHGSAIVEFFNGTMHIKKRIKNDYLTNFNKLDTSEFALQKNTCERYGILKKTFHDRMINMDLSRSKKLLKALTVYRDDFQIPSTIWSLIYNPEDLEMKIRIGDRERYYSVSLKDQKYG